MSELRILLVEDSAADAELAKVRLRGAGVVEHCTSLAAALARLADATRPRPSVVLLDLSLPDAHGLAALDRIKRAEPPPVLVMSGDDDPASERAALERGARSRSATSTTSSSPSRARSGTASNASRRASTRSCSTSRCPTASDPRR